MASDIEQLRNRFQEQSVRIRAEIDAIPTLQTLLDVVYNEFGKDRAFSPDTTGSEIAFIAKKTNERIVASANPDGTYNLNVAGALFDRISINTAVDEFIKFHAKHKSPAAAPRFEGFQGPAAIRNM